MSRVGDVAGVTPAEVVSRTHGPRSRGSRKALDRGRSPELCNLPANQVEIVSACELYPYRSFFLFFVFYMLC